MKANELMIGDWVSYDGTPIKVENIHGDCINFQHDIPFVQEEFMIDFTEIEPIHITTEILKESGFEQTGDAVFCILGNGKLFKAVWWGKRCEVGFDSPSERCLLNVYYVHELQHALRLCGLSKAADNFKI